MLWAVETGWSWTLAPVGVPDTCTEICGDGLTIIPAAGKWDDGNNISGDGWSNGCFIESGWSCSGGSPTTPHVCIDIWGDGRVMQTSPTYCDDGNNLPGDGCNNSCGIEIAWQCTLGDAISPSVCTEIWGDGMTIIDTPTNCDDQNLVSGDGCSDIWEVEVSG